MDAQSKGFNDALYLNKAIDVFITNAIVGVMPVSRIVLSDKEYTFSKSSMLIRLKNAYDACVHEYIRKYNNLIRA